MKIQIVLEKLRKAISNLEKITGKNVSLPILECVLFEAKDNTLFIRATNLHTGIEIKIPAKIEKEGIVAVKGQLINRVLQSLTKDKNINLELDGNNLNIITKDSSVKLKTQDSSDFPTLPKGESKTVFSITADKLLDGFKSVVYASANTEIKPEIASVYVYPKDDNLIFVATDSFRLAEKKVEVEAIDNFPGTIIPIKNVREIIRIFSDMEESLEMVVDNNQISFSTPDIYVVSRTVEGNFPDYEQIIPSDFVTEAVFLKKDISDAFKVIEPFSDDYNQISFSLDLDKEECTLKAQNTNTGEGETKVDGKFTGETIDLRFNYTYFTESLIAMNSDSLIFKLVANKPILIEPIGDRSFKYLIMPISR